MVPRASAGYEQDTTFPLEVLVVRERVFAGGGHR